MDNSKCTKGSLYWKCYLECSSHQEKNEPKKVRRHFDMSKMVLLWHVHSVGFQSNAFEEPYLDPQRTVEEYLKNLKKTFHYKVPFVQ